jgi:hypothetical protein
MKRRISFAIVGLLLPLSAMADWVFAVDAKAAKYWYYSPVVENKPFVKVWIKLQFSKPLQPSDVKSARQLREFDCDRGRMRTGSLTAFLGPDLDGDVYTTSNEWSQWDYVAPETNEALLWAVVCADSMAGSKPE